MASPPLAPALGLAGTVSDADYAARQASLDPRDVVNMQYTSGAPACPRWWRTPTPTPWATS